MGYSETLRWYRVTTRNATGYLGIDREDRFTHGSMIWQEFFRAWEFDHVIEALSKARGFKIVRVPAKEVDHVHECAVCHSDWPCDELSTTKHPCRKRLCEIHC